MKHRGHIYSHISFIKCIIAQLKLKLFCFLLHFPPLHSLSTFLKETLQSESSSPHFKHFLLQIIYREPRIILSPGVGPCLEEEAHAGNRLASFNRLHQRRGPVRIPGVDLSPRLQQHPWTNFIKLRYTHGHLEDVHWKT